MQLQSIKIIQTVPYLDVLAAAKDTNYIPSSILALFFKEQKQIFQTISYSVRNVDILVKFAGPKR